jgi:hypothetical protein
MFNEVADIKRSNENENMIMAIPKTKETGTGHSKALNKELLKLKIDLELKNKEDVIWELIKNWKQSKKSKVLKNNM